MKRTIVILRVTATVFLVGLVLTYVRTASGMKVSVNLGMTGFRMAVSHAPKEIYLSSALIGLVVSLIATVLSIWLTGTLKRFQWSLILAVVGIVSLANEFTRLLHDHVQILVFCPFLQVIVDWLSMRHMEEGGQAGAVRSEPLVRIRRDDPRRAVIVLRTVATVLLVGFAVTVTKTPTGTETWFGVALGSLEMGIHPSAEKIYLSSILLGFLVSLAATIHSIRLVGTARKFQWPLIWATLGIVSLTNEFTRLFHDHVQILLCFPLFQVIADWLSLRFLPRPEGPAPAPATGMDTDREAAQPDMGGTATGPM